MRPLILTTLILILLTEVGAGAPDKPLKYLAYGDLRGYLEPCGCDPKSDLGGAKRMSALLARERAIHPDLVVFDLGNNPKFDTSLGELKSPFIMEATASFGPDAVLFNQLEQKFADRVFGLLIEAKISLPYVLTEPRVKHGQVKPFLKTPMGTVYGYVHSAKSSPQKLREAILKQAVSGRRILLYSGPKAILDKLVAMNLFDEVVGSSAKPMDYTPAGFERDQVGDLTLFADEKLSVRSVPVGGQGVLRGGELTLSEAKPLEDLLNNSKQKAGGEFPLLPSGPVQQHYTWLDLSQGGEMELTALFKRYRKVTEEQFQDRVKVRVAQLKDSPYIGSAVCQGCHPSAFEVWNESAHAKAIKTLEDAGKSRDAECVSCHVVGADKKGGYVSQKHSPQLANVQCENCHGPRKAHVQNPTSAQVEDVDPKSVCISCHHPPHSTAFMFSSYWDKIKHGHEPKSDER